MACLLAQSGDSGIPTKLEWQLPKGIAAGDIVWPYPQIQRLGDLANYGYEKETLHLVPLSVAKSAHGDEKLRATAKWLVCKDVCIPGSTELDSTCPCLMPRNPTRAGRPRSHARGRQCRKPNRTGRRSLRSSNNTVSLSVTAPALQDASRISFFPYASDLVNHAKPQRIALEGEKLRLSQTASAYFVETPARVDGVLVVEHGDRDISAYEIGAKPGKVIAVDAFRRQCRAGLRPPRRCRPRTTRR